MGPARIGDLRLYLGDRHDAKDRSLLRSLKITAVLNCTPPRDESSTGCPNFFEKEPAMRYRRVPIFDTQAEDASGHFDGACDFVASRLHHGGVLVHCNRGVSRSATFVVAHLMTSAGLSVDGALDLVRETRPSAAGPDSNLQLDFNVSVRDRFDAISSALLRELDESDRFVQKSAESTSI